jgi:hemin uptake protein HemP
MRSEDLMGHRDKIEILHKGERYVLRLTRLGRLILTK